MQLCALPPVRKPLWEEACRFQLSSRWHMAVHLGVGQRAAQHFGVAQLRRKAGAHDVVGGGHALDQLARQIGVRLIGGQVDGLVNTGSHVTTHSIGDIIGSWHHG